MKRIKKTVEKRTYAMKGAIPMYVSLVGRGANFTPFTQLRYDESEKFGQDIEINRIEFAKTQFPTQEMVEQYLRDNAYDQFSVVETDTTFMVAGAEADKFEDVAPIEYEDGVLYFVGKLKNAEDIETPAADVVAVEEFGDTTSQTVEGQGLQGEQTPTEAVDEHNADVDEEASESQEDEDEEPEDDEEADSVKASDEEVKSEEQTSEHSEGQEGFSAKGETESEAQEEVVDESKLVLTFSDEVKAVFEQLKAEITSLKEELEVFKQNQQETVDETQIVIQNSQAVNSDEIIVTQHDKQKDEKAVQFSQNRTKDLFGLRG